MMARGLILILLIGGSLGALADDSYSPRYAGCMDESGGVTADMIDCIAEELAAQDARLNAVYGIVSGRMPTERRATLQAAQRLWIQFRDANCQFHADPDGGTLAVVAGNECVLRLTRQRANELDALMPPD